MNIIKTIGIVFILNILEYIIAPFSTMIITKSLTVAEDKLQENLEYVSYEVLTDNIMPVSKEETTDEIVRPYTDTSVEIGKSYYDYKEESENQEDSIIYYENTYIQNTGVDYISKNVFDVNAIADGKVISVTEDDIVGITVKIEHNNNMISVYQSIKDVTVKENDQITKGQVIATSGTNNISSDLGNHLHFELYTNGQVVDPSLYIDKELN